MPDYNYNFSKSKYRKRIFYIIPIGVLIAIALCFISFIQGRLDFLFGLMVFIFCVITSILIFQSKTICKSGSRLFFNNGILNYVDIVKNGYTRMLDFKHTSYHYLIYSIADIAITEKEIVLKGNIKKITTYRSNTFSDRKEQAINVVIIPDFFEDREHLINSIYSLLGGN